MCSSIIFIIFIIIPLIFTSFHFQTLQIGKLVFVSKYQSPYFPNLFISFKVLSKTLTITEFPACLYKILLMQFLSPLFFKKELHKERNPVEYNHHSPIKRRLLISHPDDILKLRELEDKNIIPL